jgi:hypothetical protein
MEADWPMRHAPLRAQLASILTDNRLKGRFILTDNIFPILNATILDGHELKQNVFSSALSGSDGISFQLYSSILDDESELEAMEIGAQAVFAVKKYRDGNDRRIGVGCFDSEEVLNLTGNATEYHRSRIASVRQEPFLVPSRVQLSYDKYVRKYHTRVENNKPIEQQSAKRTSRDGAFTLQTREEQRRSASWRRRLHWV